MSANISRDEWLSALADTVSAKVDDQDSLTVREFAERFQIATSTARLSVIPRLLKEGRIRETTKIIPYADRRRLFVRSFRLVEKGGSDAQRPPQRRRDLRRRTHP